MTRFLSLGIFLALSLQTAQAMAHGNTPHEDHCSEMADHQLGNYTFPISTTNPAVQKLVNQGINWAFGFNHAAAEERFEAALKLDPECAMCYWGLAYVKGPNINAPMPAEAVPVAFHAISEAIERLDQVTTKEAALIRALSARYTANPADDRVVLDQAYANAMKEVAKAYPDDENIATLAVEALMDTMPWNYWTPDGKPREGTEEMIRTLKNVLEKNPLHPGAIHFLIHIVEKERPELAEAEADRLVDLVPGAGHLQHMAAHIYIRVGRYHDAVRVNELAIKADQEYLAMCPDPDNPYRLLYVPHNYHFLVAAAIFEGREQLARKTAQDLRKYIEPYAQQSPEAVDLQQFWITPLLAAIRFQDWTSVMQEAEPRESWIYARALWHFGRARAMISMGKVAEASVEIMRMEELAMREDMKTSLLAGLNPAAHVLMIGVEEVKGELAFMQKNFDQAIQHFHQAVERQDSLTYIEPPAWYQSMRLALGKAYQAAGRYTDAERVYREDLDEFPKNGWALFGLYTSLSAQHRLDEAAQVLADYKKAWQYADTEAGPDQIDI
ncbi:tetratricopeptide repeat protein [Oligoflexus tunisiensis]|uniref:tetratricopeptide repeat protein n=1 Tax=Oligoflexus tunisiensis TaxID=708132 RepID=UPI000A7B95FB|nr:tetratricopeptide repeat protein [Oligoflexus tunisiensis]